MRLNVRPSPTNGLRISFAKEDSSFALSATLITFGVFFISRLSLDCQDAARAPGSVVFSYSIPRKAGTLWARLEKISAGDDHGVSAPAASNSIVNTCQIGSTSPPGAIAGIANCARP